MSDLISRRQAICALSTITMYKGSIPYNTAVMRIEQLPSAQPEPSWDCEKCMMEHTDEMEKLEAELAIAKSKQPEPCEDAVSRQAIKDIVFKSPFFANSLLEEVDTLPSVTPKQRTGKWIKLDMHRGMADHKCTACEQECYVPTCMGEPLYAFCPNCGSYNGGEQDDKCRQV